jgi:hypothetical protein
MTEKEKMLSGEIYSAVDPQLLEELTEVKEVIHDYNLLRPSEKLKAREILTCIIHRGSIILLRFEMNHS